MSAEYIGNAYSPNGGIGCGIQVPCPIALCPAEIGCGANACPAAQCAANACFGNACALAACAADMCSLNACLTDACFLYFVVHYF